MITRNLKEGQKVFWKGDINRNFPNFIARIYGDRILVKEGLFSGVIVSRELFNRRYN